MCYDMGMIKKDYRQLVLQRLAMMTPEDKLRKDLALLSAVVASSSYQEAQTLATYLPLPHEYQSHLLIERALQDGKTILVPKTRSRGEMVFVAYDPCDLIQTAFGLMEPRSTIAVAKSEIDAIHVPGLVFHPAGYRIGYGGGYYDRYLRDYQGATFSTIYACQWEDFVVEAHDIAVKEVYCQ